MKKKLSADDKYWFLSRRITGSTSSLLASFTDEIKEKNASRPPYHYFYFQGMLRVRKRVTLMVITVSAIFGVTWLTNSSNYLLHHFLKYSFLTYASASLMVLFNSAINPVLYALMSQRFRNKMKQIMRCTYRSGKIRKRSTGGHEIKGERGNSQVST